MKFTANKRLFWIGFTVFALDQLTKQAVLRFLGTHEEREVIVGFFKFVHWKNTGAAWSLFSSMDGSSKVLAAVSGVAFVALLWFRKHFGSESRLGQLALGLVFGGIVGNFCDRLFLNHVVDFIRFYLRTRSGEEMGFPAFNIADSGICVGVGLLFVMSWFAESNKEAAAKADPAKASVNGGGA